MRLNRKTEEASDHPCSDVAKGERCLKDFYEALRSGPGWERTLFLVVCALQLAASVER